MVSRTAIFCISYTRQGDSKVHPAGFCAFFGTWAVEVDMSSPGDGGFWLLAGLVVSTLVLQQTAGEFLRKVRRFVRQSKAPAVWEVAQDSGAGGLRYWRVPRVILAILSLAGLSLPIHAAHFLLTFDEASRAIATQVQPTPNQSCCAKDGDAGLGQEHLVSPEGASDPNLRQREQENALPSKVRWIEL